jgi:hypothetical protein
MARAGLLGEDAATLSKKSQNVDNFAGQQKASISNFAASARAAVDSGRITSAYSIAGVPEFVKDAANKANQAADAGAVGANNSAGLPDGRKRPGEM